MEELRSFTNIPQEPINTSYNNYIYNKNHNNEKYNQYKSTPRFNELSITNANTSERNPIIQLNKLESSTLARHGSFTDNNCSNIITRYVEMLTDNKPQNYQVQNIRKRSASCGNENDNFSFQIKILHYKKISSQ